MIRGRFCIVWVICTLVGCAANQEVPESKAKPLTTSCAGMADPRSVMKSAFESRAAQSVQFLERYVERLNETINALRSAYTKASRVCRLYALDEVADIYTTKLVKFDLADRANLEAEQLLSEIDCCTASYHFAGTLFPLHRQVYSYLFGVNESGLSASSYPKEFLGEVARRDLGEVARRVQMRKHLLDQVLLRKPSTEVVNRVHYNGTAEQELTLWRESLKASDFPEGMNALLVLDRIWGMRSYIDEATWLRLVGEAGETALRLEDKSSPGRSRAAILLRFRLGSVLLRLGQIEKGVGLYAEMLQQVAIYQKMLESEFERVQSAIAWEKTKAGAKTALAGGLGALAFGMQLAGSAAQAYVGIVGSSVTQGGQAMSQLVAQMQATQARQLAASAIQLGSPFGAWLVDAINPSLEAGVQAFQYARYKSLETVRLFGDTPRALPLFLNEHERLEFHRDLGEAYDRLGTHQAAIDQYKSAIEIIETERAGLGRQATRLAFFQEKERVYAQLIPLLVRAGDVTAAFEYAERSRSRNFVDLLASTPPQFSTTAESSAYEQQRREQAEVELAVERTGLTHHEVTRLRGHQRGIAVVQSSAVATVAKNGTVAPPSTAQGEEPPKPNLEFESLTAVRALPMSDIGIHLGDQAALLAFFVGDQETVVFLIQDGKASAWIRPIGRPELHKQVSAFRRLIQENPQTSRNDPAAIQKSARQLYEMLLKDAVADLHKTILYIAPHGPLHYVPFVALHDGSSWLVDRFTTVNIASGTVLTYLAKKPRATMGRTVVFANPDLGDPVMDLPFAELEGQAVRARQPHALLLTRKEAQEAKVRKTSHDARILHFATHGNFDTARPMESALLLAKGEGDDGILKATEVFGLALPGTLVVLSACETGLSQIATGDEILGLTRAFMYAGAPQVIATLWEIDDEATAVLMDHFYGGLGKHSPTSALRTAQIHLRKRHPEPFYWAGFVPYGIER